VSGIIDKDLEITIILRFFIMHKLSKQE